MPEYFSVEADPTDIARIKFMLATIKDGERKALRTAISKTLDTGKSRVAKRVAEVVNLPINKEIRPRITLGRPRLDNLVGYIFVHTDPIPMVKYPHIVIYPIGASVEMYKLKTPQIFRHVFKATMPSGHTGLFERRYDQTGIPTGRLPIGQGFISGGASEMHGPSIGKVFFYNGSEAVTIDISDVLSKNLLHEADYLLQKAAGF